MVPSVICTKDVDILSITDHNTAENIAAFLYLCKNKVIVPGIEIHTLEDVHILGYFSTLDDAMEVSKVVGENTEPFPYDPERFGYQLLLNQAEEFVGTLDNYLGFPTNLSIDQTVDLIKKYGGLAVFAHADRKFGAIDQLGILPKGTNIVEVRKKETCQELRKSGYIVLASSDAHVPDEIGSRKIFFQNEAFCGKIDSKSVIENIALGRFRTIWD
ncbi:MAG TPA: phosphotransferase [Fervidobacterium sp.]|nr:phosphotransferase [Fervidobacterium sp.]